MRKKKNQKALYFWIPLSTGLLIFNQPEYIIRHQERFTKNKTLMHVIFHKT